MAIQRQLRRGTKAENDSFTGAIGELVQDTSSDRIIIHDGSQAGGFGVPNHNDIIGQYFQAVDASGTDTIIVTLPYAPSAYAEYQQIMFKPSANNTGAATLNVNSLGAKNIKKDDGSGTLIDLEADDLKGNIPVTCVYDGTQFIIQLGGGGGNGWDLISTATASSSSVVDFTSGIDGTYDVYMFTLADVTPSADTNFQIQFSTNGGSSYISSGYAYNQMVLKGATSIANFGAASSGSILVTGNVSGWGTATGEGISGFCYLHAPSTTNVQKKITFDICGLTNDGFFQVCQGYGGRYATTAIDAIRFAFSSGTVESGEFALYGLKK